MVSWWLISLVNGELEEKTSFCWFGGFCRAIVRLLATTSPALSDQVAQEVVKAKAFF